MTFQESTGQCTNSCTRVCSSPRNSLCAPTLTSEPASSPLHLKLTPDSQGEVIFRYWIRAHSVPQGIDVLRGQGILRLRPRLVSALTLSKDLLAAINHTKHGNAIAAAHRKQPPSLAGRVASYIVPGFHSGPEWIAQMTPLERHAELVYAESLYQKVCLVSAKSCSGCERATRVYWAPCYPATGSLSSRNCELFPIIAPSGSALIIRHRLNMRTTMSIYRQLGRWLESVDTAYTTAQTGESHPRVLLEDPSVDRHFRSGVYLGLGMTHLALSLMPGRVLTIVEMFGYRADRKEGLRYLERPGGWSSGRAENVISQGQFTLKFPVICSEHLEL